MILLLTMMFFHILDDFCLQGILANLKQKQWWQEHAPEELYKNDWIIALTIHAFSWTFMIHLPILYYFSHYSEHLYQSELPILIFLITFAVDWFIHAVVDNLKANKKKINLITDQCIHIAQIIIT